MPKSIVVRSRSEACVDAGKGFVSTTGPVGVGEGDISLALFIAGAGKVTRITRIIMSDDNTRRFRLCINPNIGAEGNNGEEQGARNRRVGKGQTAVSKLYKSPTFAGEGASLGDVAYDFWVNPSSPLTLNFLHSPWIFDAAKKLHIMTCGGAGQNASVAVEWDEEPA